MEEKRQRLILKQFVKLDGSLGMAKHHPFSVIRVIGVIRGEIAALANRLRKLPVSNPLGTYGIERRPVS